MPHSVADVASTQGRDRRFVAVPPMMIIATLGKGGPTSARASPSPG